VAVDEEDESQVNRSGLSYVGSDFGGGGVDVVLG
jgi:hypothetical protein